MKRFLYVLVPILALGLMIAWRLNLKKTEAAQQTKLREARMKTPPMVSVAPAQTRDIVQTFEAVGSVEAPFNVKIAPRLTGQIDYLQAREGDRVKKGQVLVRIDPADLNSLVRQQQAALAEAQYRLAQAQINQNPTNVSVTTQIQQQAATLASAQADYTQVKENYAAQQATAAAAVTDAQGRVDNANATIGNAEAAIRSAQANLDNAQARYNRILDLYKQGFIAAQDVDDARTTVRVQQSALDAARGQLTSAQAARDSAAAQKQSAQEQASIVTTKGKADIAAARAKVAQAEAALRYARANTAQKPAYQQNLAALRASVAAAQAAVRSAESHRADTILTAPLDGYITGRMMDPGSLATPGQPILAIQAIREVWVTLPVPEEISRKIFLGQSARAAFDALPDRVFTGKITQINPSADPLSRQFAVRVSLDNRQNLIKPGMFARVTLETERVRSAVVVPREAVQQSPQGAAVTVIDSADTAHRRPVTVGASDSDGIAITRGVQPGEQVVILSGMPLKDGQAVRIGGQK